MSDTCGSATPGRYACSLRDGHQGPHFSIIEHEYVISVAQEAEGPKRVPVDYRYDAINPTFLKWMAKIGAYASDKYGSWDQYKTVRLEGEKSPINHVYEHLRSYQVGDAYDHFDGDVRWHLVAVAYNAMMEFFYCTKWGHVRHPLEERGTIKGHEKEGPLGPGSGDRSQG